MKNKNTVIVIAFVALVYLLAERMHTLQVLQQYRIIIVQVVMFFKCLDMVELVRLM